MRSVPTLIQPTLAPVHGPFNPVRKVLQSPRPKFPPTVIRLVEKLVPVSNTGPLASDTTPLVRVAVPLTVIGSACALAILASRKATTAKKRSSFLGDCCRDVCILRLTPYRNVTLEEAQDGTRATSMLRAWRGCGQCHSLTPRFKTNYRHVTDKNSPEEDEFRSIEESMSNPPCVSTTEERSDLQKLIRDHVRTLKARVDRLKS